jgi:hypothetical protein
MKKLTTAELQEITKKATAKDPILVGDNGFVLKKSPFTEKIAKAYQAQGVNFTEYPEPTTEAVNEEIADLDVEMETLEAAQAEIAAEEVDQTNPPAPVAEEAAPAVEAAPAKTTKSTKKSAPKK